MEEKVEVWTGILGGLVVFVHVCMRRDFWVWKMLEEHWGLLRIYLG
jgi:hypothetical protein